jgi:hypothetical protein
MAIGMVSEDPSAALLAIKALTITCMHAVFVCENFTYRSMVNGSVIRIMCTEEIWLTEV